MGASSLQVMGAPAVALLKRHNPGNSFINRSEGSNRFFLSSPWKLTQSTRGIKYQWKK